ncbi:hypothetical protein H6G80_15240 [Nostoc sp. FACHB-87]|nr:hypothetical protein [Nostoc sp. FACHB-87]
MKKSTKKKPQQNSLSTRLSTAPDKEESPSHNKRFKFGDISTDRPDKKEKVNIREEEIKFYEGFLKKLPMGSLLPDRNYKNDPDYEPEVEESEVEELVERGHNVFTMATLNLDHYGEKKEETKDKQEARMNEIAYLLSTNVPDVLVIQEINNYDTFKADFEEAKNLMLVETDEKSKEVFDIRNETSLTSKKISDSYALLEMPKWVARSSGRGQKSSWSEKNVIIYNTATIQPSNLEENIDKAAMFRYQNIKEGKLMEVEGSQEFAFGVKGSNYEPRAPIVAEFVYRKNELDERKIGIINVHTTPTGDSYGKKSSLKQQNLDIRNAMLKYEKERKPDAVFAIGDFYMENSDTEAFANLHPEIYGGDSHERSVIRAAPAYFTTNNPNHAKHNDEKDRKKKVGQHADDMLFLGGFRPYTNLPSTLPPMFTLGLKKADRQQKNLRRKRALAEIDSYITSYSWSKPKPIKKGGKTYSRRSLVKQKITGEKEEISVQDQVKKRMKEVSERSEVLKQSDIDFYQKPNPDHALRVFRGEFTPKQEPVARQGKQRSILKAKRKRM